MEMKNIHLSYSALFSIIALLGNCKGDTQDYLERSFIQSYNNNKFKKPSQLFTNKQRCKEGWLAMEINKTLNEEDVEVKRAMMVYDFTLKFITQPSTAPIKDMPFLYCQVSRKNVIIDHPSNPPTSFGQYEFFLTRKDDSNHRYILMPNREYNVPTSRITRKDFEIAELVGVPLETKELVIVGRENMHLYFNLLMPRNVALGLEQTDE